MDEITTGGTSEEIVCKNCSSTSVEPGYRVPLCPECRDNLSRRPIPGWIKASFILMALILILSLAKFPAAMKAGISYERAVKAESDKNYVSAMKQYKKVADQYPESTQVEAKLFVSYSYNDKLKEAGQVFKKIEGKKSSDDELLTQVKKSMEMLDANYNYDDELLKIIELDSKDPNKSLSELKAYLAKNTNSGLGYLYLGNTYFDLGDYKEAKASFQKAIEVNPKALLYHINLAGAYRQLGEFDNAIAEVNKVLDENAESVLAISSLSRIELKRHNYKEALVYAQKANNLDNDNLETVNTLAIAYHYNQKYKERDQLTARLKKGNYYDLDRTMAIINGQLKIYD